MQAQRSSYVLTPSVKGLIQQLKHLSLFGDAVLVVEGEDGVGKTSLSHVLLEAIKNEGSVESSIVASRLTVTEKASEFDVLADIARCAGLSISGAESGKLLANLRAYGEKLRREQRLFVLLMDNLEIVDDRLLGALLSLLQNGQESAYGMRLVCFSQPGLAARIDALTTLDTKVYDFVVPSLSASELSSVLTSVYPGFQDLLEQESLPSLNTIWNRSRGNPGKAIDYVLEHMPSDSPEVQAKDFSRMPVVHILLLAFLVAALALIVLYGGAENGGSVADDDAPILERVIPESQFAAGPAGADKPSIIIAEVSDQNAVISDPIVVDAATPKPLAVVVAQDEREGASEHSADRGVASVASADTGSVAGSDHVIPKEKLPASDVSVVVLTKDELFLLEQPDGGYVLQLLAASRRQNLDRYIKTQPNAPNLRIHRKIRNQGAHWFVVVIGPFSSRSEANKALTELPEAQRKSAPWPKSIKAVKQDILSFRDK